ncbi:outer membrane lipoprotein carrier protein LolA [Streptomyces sp. NPDC006879]|uniref:LolA family protein n=1 Tax=Streptomyces sp. NPDC006879 TaxID=3364767 RepID=UPI0036C2683D
MAANAGGAPEQERVAAAEEAADLRAGRRRAARYVVPITVAGVAAATIGLVPALAANGSPDLPEITAQQLIEKIAGSQTEQLSGTLKVSTDLGLPGFGGGALSGLAKGLVGDEEGGSSASPESKLMELTSGTHTLKIAADGPDRQKLTFLNGQEEYSLIHNGKDAWGYDSASGQAVHESVPEAGAGHGVRSRKEALKDAPTPRVMAQEVLKATEGTTSVSLGSTLQVAGRDAYQLVLKPKQSGSTVDSIRIAVDAGNGTPLRFSVLSSSGGKPIAEAGFTKVDFGKPAAAAFTLPKGTKVVPGDRPAEDHAGAKDSADTGALSQGLKDFKPLESLPIPGLDGLGAQGKETEVIGEGWASVARIGTAQGAVGGATKDMPKEAGQFLDSLGKKVSGTFGGGRIFTTRLVNVLMTDHGTVYVGAVTQDTLLKAANSAR